MDLDAADPMSWEIPDPDSSGMEPGVVAQLRAAREALLKDPGSAGKWARLGAVSDVHMLLGAAESCYRNAHRLAPDNFQWPYHLAIVLEARGAPADEVVSWFRKAASRNPSYLPVYVRMGKVFSAQGRLAEAREAYLKAIALDAESAIAHRGLGQVLLGLGEPEQAVVQLERAAELAPKDALTHAALAQGYHRLGDRQRADEADQRSRRFQAIALSDPARERVVGLGRSASQCWDRANKLIAIGDFEGALECLESAAETHPESPYIQLRLAHCYLRTGASDAARVHFSNALELKEAWEAASGEPGALPIAAGELEEVIWHARCDRLAFVSKSGPPESVEQELAEFKRAAEEVVLDYEPEMCLARALLKLGQREEAVDHYQKAAQIAPDRFAPHRMLGLALERLGRIDEAVEAYREAAKINPNSAAAESLAKLEAVER